VTHRILITGGFGYIGGRLAQALDAQRDTHVLLGSRFLRDVPKWLPSASVAVTNWGDSASLQGACSGVDTILHLAAMNEVDAAQDPVGALESAGVATARLMESAKAKHVSRFVYFSTAHVYGAPLAGYIDESVCPRPVHPYATSHRAAEDVVLAEHEKGELPGIVLRISNGFGAPAHPDVNRWTLLVNDLCRQAIVTGKLELRSAGLQRRDFITLTDVCRATSHMLNLPVEVIGNGIFNIGGNWTPTISEVTSLVAGRCGVVLGFRPEINLPEPMDGETSIPLDYCIDKLRNTGFKLQGDRDGEIDATLKLCYKAFSTCCERT